MPTVQNLTYVLGLITRSQAEELLDEKEVHSFLIRLSDKVWGYTISYRCEERIKHFLIDACHFKKVKFDGNSEKLHKDLHALISFHEVSYKTSLLKKTKNVQTNPISPAGEVLKFPVGQANEDDPDYSELLSDEDWTLKNGRKFDAKK